MTSSRFVPWLDLVAAARGFAAGVAVYRSGRAMAQAAARCGLKPDGDTPAGQAHASTLQALRGLACAYGAAPAAVQPMIAAAIRHLVVALDAWPTADRAIGWAVESREDRDTRPVVEPWWLREGA
jgi:hypothetical protein